MLPSLSYWRLSCCFILGRASVTFLFFFARNRHCLPPLVLSLLKISFGAITTGSAGGLRRPHSRRLSSVYFFVYFRFEYHQLLQTIGLCQFERRESVPVSPGANLFFTLCRSRAPKWHNLRLAPESSHERSSILFITCILLDGCSNRGF
jgi:hypothetical protein